ncbi:probable arginine--tRNA ligase, mitochondrial, partial [Diadema setosum]|uniref:probable arginine--tRNA ligase, mitochondrial n=1 Tax=Diadema setosum TaxID=31175 RepID=UPI003B3AE289
NSYDLKLGLRVGSLPQQNGPATNQTQRGNGKAMDEVAWKIAKEVACPEHVHNIKIESGVMQFTLDSKHFMEQVLKDAFRGNLGHAHPCYPLEESPLNVIVEFSSPNVAKPFHVGHLRSTLIGNFLANLQELLGHNVTRINYLGDWGTQFGILGVGFQEFGNEEELNHDPIGHLYKVYVTANRAAEEDPQIRERAKELFRKMEQGNSDALALRQRFIDLSISEFTRTYERLGIRFDEYRSESEYGYDAQTLLDELRQRRLLHTSERGTEEIDVSEACPRFPLATLARSDGSSLYLTRDVVAALERRRRYQFDRMYYVVDKGQEGHFEQLKGVLAALGEPWGQQGIHHIKFGKVLGMQTRKGTAVFLTNILNEAKARMLHNMENTSTTKASGDTEQVAEALGLSAIILQDLKGALLTDYSFDWDKMLASKGDTGVFLQYAHARLYSIEETNGWQQPPSCLPELNVSLLSEPEAVQLAWHVGHYDVAVKRAAEEMEPKAVAQYLLQLGHLVSRASNKLRVKGSPMDLQKARLALFHTARSTLGHGMRLLGIQPLKRM